MTDVEMIYKRVLPALKKGGVDLSRQSCYGFLILLRESWKVNCWNSSQNDRFLRVINHEIDRLEHEL